MSYAFPKDQPDGTEVELSNGVIYKYSDAKNRWAVKSIVPDIDHVTKSYVINAVKGHLVSAGRTFQGYSGFPTSTSKFTTDNAQPGMVTKIYMHRDYMEQHFQGPGKTFKHGGAIDIHDASTQEVIGMYFAYRLIDNGGSDIYFSVHGLSTTSRNLIAGTNYGMSFACSFNS